MGALKKILATICAILFVITAVIALFLFNLDRRAFTAETYQRAFARDDFYNKIPGLMAEAVTSSTAGQSQFSLMISGMSKETWEAFFRALLPPETLKGLGDEALNSIFAYLNMQTDTAKFDLAPLKASMVSDRGVQAVFSLLSAQPDCAFVQIAQMTTNLFSGDQPEFCNPPAELHPAFAPIIQGQLQLMSAMIPDQVTLISVPPENDPRQGLQVARLYMRLSPILPLTLLLGMTIFAVRSLKSWLRWWGIPLFISGAIAFMISLSGAPAASAIFQALLVKRMPVYLPSILLGYAGDLASAMASALLRPVVWQGLAIVLIGFGMAVISYFVKKKK